MEFLEHLAQEVEQTGHTVVCSDFYFLVAPINLKIEVEVGERNDHSNNGQLSVVITIHIKASHGKLFPDGILDCLAGIGETEADAYSYAARVWTAGVFAPIHEILVPRETEGFAVKRMNIVTRNEDCGALEFVSAG